MADFVDPAIAKTVASMVEAGKITPPGAEDPGFAAWTSKYGIKPYDSTYDTYAAYRDGLKPDSRGHLDDTHKLPNHPTFSTDSKYSGINGQTGGEWVKTSEPSPGMSEGTWEFRASPWNLQNLPADQLKKYFDEKEGGMTLVLPDGTRYTAPKSDEN